MEKKYSADQMAIRWFIVTIFGAALYIGAVFFFVL